MKAVASITVSTMISFTHGLIFFTEVEKSSFSACQTPTVKHRLQLEVILGIACRFYFIIPQVIAAFHLFASISGLKPPFST